MKTLQRGIKQVVNSLRAVEGGGFVVRRPLGSSRLPMVDPFLLLDHFGPVKYNAGEAVGAPDHPHRGFETVSYILQGGMQHKDSRGNEGKLGPGDVQWMTAGSGLVHSEMPADNIAKDGGTLEGFQLWVNLPKKDKWIAPRYQDIPSARIPEYLRYNKDTPSTLEVRVRVVAGESGDKKAVIDTRTPIYYLDIQLQAEGVEFQQALPSNFGGFLYVYRGAGTFGTNSVEAKDGQLLELAAVANTKTSDTKDAQDQSVVTVKSVGGPMHCLLIAGMPLNEPVARYGPFVMNTQSEIRQAFEDYRNGKMGAIDGADERYEQNQLAVKKSGGPVFNS